MTKIVIQERYKSAVLWSAITAQIVTLLIALGVIDTGLGETVNLIVASVLQILVGIGIFNDPTSKNKF
jgi:uncharacterized membrane protein